MDIQNYVKAGVFIPVMLNDAVDIVAAIPTRAGKRVPSCNKVTRWRTSTITHALA